MTGRPYGFRGVALALVLLASLCLVTAPLAAAGADISITDASLERSTAAPGDPAVVRVTVTNAGDEAGSRSLQLTGNGKAYVQTLIRLDGGETRTVTIDQAFKRPGEYDLAVDGMAVGTLTVVDPSTTDQATRAGVTTDRRPGDVTLTAWVLIVVLGGALTAGSVYFVRGR